jgi:hypothetical protein
MNAATLKRLAIALLILLVVWLGLAQLRASRKETTANFTLPRFNRGAVDAVTITRASDTLRLMKQGVGWTVNGFAATASAVAELLDAAADTTARGDLVAKNPGSHARLGIDSVSARAIGMLAGGKPVFTILVGKRGEDFSSGYVRLPGQNRVYQLKGKLAELADRGLDDWRDKKIVALAPDSVDRIEITRGKRGYALARNGSAWMVGAAPADSAAVTALLEQVKQLQASGFANAAQADSARQATPNRNVRFLGKGRLLAELAFDSTAAGYWARLGGSPTVYKLDSWVVDRLTPADSTLRKK